MMTAERHIEIEGTIDANGRANSNGGGSGGSILVVSPKVTGEGELRANGGDGQYTGYPHHCYSGGGGGGRVALHASVLPTFTYIAKHVTLPIAVDGGKLRDGGKGTVALLTKHEGCYQAFLSGDGDCNCTGNSAGEFCTFSCDSTRCGAGNCTSGLCECPTYLAGKFCQNSCTRESNCTNGGVCGACGACLCSTCFSGPHCEVECGGHGQCDAGECSCNFPYSGRYCEKICSDHGSYDHENAVCNCDNEIGNAWSGSVCQIRSCPSWDDDQVCSGHGVCTVATSRCSCDPGWTGSACNITVSQSRRFTFDYC